MRKPDGFNPGGLLADNNAKRQLEHWMTCPFCPSRTVVITETTSGTQIDCQGCEEGIEL